MVKNAGLFIVLLAACTAAGVLAAAGLADTPPPATTTTAAAPATVPAGVVLGGVAIGGLTADAATQAVLARFAQPAVLRVGDRTIRVTPASMGVEVPADAAVAKALTVQPGTSLGLRASVNVADVRAFIAQLAGRYNHKAVAARLLLRNLKPFVTMSERGLVIERAAAVLALRKALANGVHTPVDVPAHEPKPTVATEAAGPVIVIRRGSNVLNLYRGVKLVRQFHVATGQSIYPTPLGRFQIIVKWKNPWWYPPNDAWAKGEKPTPPGPDNPLGTRWMGISSPGVGIHGTPESGSIGYSLSHGCIRMLIPQAEWVFDRVNVGTPVFIVSA